jgi:hypothetical protein
LREPKEEYGETKRHAGAGHKDTGPIGGRIGHGPVNGFAQSKLSWKLNLAKSKFSPGPPPKSSTLTYLVEGQSLTATLEGVDAQDKPTKVVQGPYFYDGKSYPVTGAAAYDASSYRIVDNTTDEITRTKMGKVVQTVIEVLSEDGRTLTFTVTGCQRKRTADQQCCRL